MERAKRRARMGEVERNEKIAHPQRPKTKKAGGDARMYGRARRQPRTGESGMVS